VVDRRARALLAYLVLATSPVSRRALAELLCAEGDEQDQLATLRQAIYVARKAMEAAIVQAQGSDLRVHASAEAAAD
jgi:DNA-binding SARP family transcriptional activator